MQCQTGKHEAYQALERWWDTLCYTVDTGLLLCCYHAAFRRPTAADTSDEPSDSYHDIDTVSPTERRGRLPPTQSKPNTSCNEDEKRKTIHRCATTLQTLRTAVFLRTDQTTHADNSQLPCGDYIMLFWRTNSTCRAQASCEVHSAWVGFALYSEMQIQRLFSYNCVLYQAA